MSILLEPKYTSQQGRVCSLDDCGRPAISRGWCTKHYQRIKTHGTPGPAGDLPKRHPYRSTHQQIRRVKGPAAAHLCVDCGGAAEEWSYNGLDPHELVDPDVHGRGIRCVFSTRPEFYDPRCKPCHRRFDRSAERKR